MRSPLLVILATLLTAFAYTGIGTSAAEAKPMRFWTVAKSETWNGTPSDLNRFMATVGQSELSSGLQSSGFRGTADLNWVEGPVRPGVSRAITLTALKARITKVSRRDGVVTVAVKLEPKGYELVAVDMSEFQTGDLVTFIFQDATDNRLSSDQVRIE